MPLMRPPPNARTEVPILTAAFLLHAEKNAIRTETVRGVGFNEFLQYTSFHKFLLFVYPCTFIKNFSSIPNGVPSAKV